MFELNHKHYDNVRRLLMSAVIGLTRAAEGNRNRPDAATHRALLLALCMVQDTRIDEQAMAAAIAALHAAKVRLVPRCAACAKACGRNDDFNWNDLVRLAPELLELKYNLLADLLALAAALTECRDEVLFNSGMEFLYQAFFVWGRSNNYETLSELRREAAEYGEKLQTV